MDDIVFRCSHEDLGKMFSDVMRSKFEMSLLDALNFFSRAADILEV